MQKRLFNLTPGSAGGESIFLSLKKSDDGSISEEFCMNSYGNTASFNTSGVFTSENLFRLAKEVLEFELQNQPTEN